MGGGKEMDGFCVGEAGKKVEGKREEQREQRRGAHPKAQGGNREDPKGETQQDMVLFVSRDVCYV